VATFALWFIDTDVETAAVSAGSDEELLSIWQRFSRMIKGRWRRGVQALYRHGSGSKRTGLMRD
jgi:hypothetical protein